ncbi:MAG: DUF2797 domain-containing protein [Acidiferrobacterales bacterium]
MKASGHIRKMKTVLEDVVQYHLPLDDQRISLNQHLGQKISMTHNGNIHCINCGRKTNKSFSQGYCFPCMRSLARCDSCIIKPELCHYHEGTCREPQWGEENCMQTHTVYLANTSGIKVGITRGSQVPTRWMDQGAVAALPIFKVSNRLLSGKVEVLLKQNMSDKTNWRTMLKGNITPVDLLKFRDQEMNAWMEQLTPVIKQAGKQSVLACEEQQVTTINYPVNRYPEKVTSFNFDKTPQVSGLLNGIKGQYLILDGGVINMRKFAGYEIELEVKP